MQCRYGLRDNEYILLRDTMYVLSERCSVSTVLEVLHEYAFVRGTEYLLSKWYCVRTKRCCVGTVLEVVSTYRLSTVHLLRGAL